jgi:hypothetical protein
MSLLSNVEAELGCDNFPIGSKISLCRAGVMLFSFLFCFFCQKTTELFLDEIV